MKDNRTLNEVAQEFGALPVVDESEEIITEATEWEHTIKGSNCRIRYGGKNGGADQRDFMWIEELPGKPLKRKVRRMVINTWYYVQVPRNSFKEASSAFDNFILDNILLDAKLHAGMSYDAAVTAMKKAVEKAVVETEKAVHDGGETFDFAKYGGMNSIFNEKLIFYLEVEPADYKPMKIEGKDYTFTLEWTGFKIYSPSSDFQQSDPHYQYYSESSPKDARTFFKLMKADPNQLKTVSWMVLSDWLKKNGVNTESHASTWS